jgi:hypothetical protein
MKRQSCVAKSACGSRQGHTAEVQDTRIVALPEGHLRLLREIACAQKAP